MVLRVLTLQLLLDYLLLWVIQEPSSPLLMEPLGLKEPLEHQTILKMLFLEMDLSWLLVILGQY